MGPIRFAVVGTNTISDRFVEATRLSDLDVSRIVAVCSREEETAQRFAARHGISKTYTDYEKMLSSDEIDAVYIATPNFTHKRFVLAALRAKKHVLCEKIIGQSTEELDEMMEAAATHGCVLLEAMRPDFDPMIEAFRAAISMVGRLRRASFEYCQYSSRYDKFLSGEVLRAFDPQIGNCALADIGIYPLHLCVSLFGLPRSVSSRSVFLENGFEGIGTATLDYADRGFFASVTHSKITESVSPTVIEGELGSLLLDKINEPHRITFVPRKGEPVVLATANEENNMVYEIEAFARMVKGKMEHAPYLSITHDTMLVFDMIKKESNIRI